MIKIVCDSTASIPEDYAKNKDLRVVPLRVLVGEQEYEEHFENGFSEIYEYAQKMHFFPKTSQPSYELYLKAFNEIIDEGNEVLCITITSALSGTNSVAHLAKNDSKKPEAVTVFDSDNLCQPTCYMVQYAYDLIEEGVPMAELLVKLESIKKGSAITFIPDTLDYLKNGGRIGKLGALLGSILQIKPIFIFTQGALKVAKKSIGMGRAIADIISSIPQNVKKLYVLKCGSPKNYDMFKQIVMNKRPNEKFTEGYIGPVVGSHVGP
ncbi:MAG: DegV family protein, partial [Clostridia bacterium]